MFTLIMTRESSYYCTNNNGYVSELKIIAKLISHITDLRIYISGRGNKALEQIEAEIEETERCCLRLCEDDEEL